MPMKLRQIENMMIVLIRHEQAFLNARTQLTVSTFPEKHAGFAVIWAIVCDHYDEFGEMPDEEQIAAELEARTEDDPEFSDIALEQTDAFLREAFRAADDVLPKYVKRAFSYLKQYLDDRLMENLRGEVENRMHVPTDAFTLLTTYASRAREIQQFAADQDVIRADQLMLDFPEQAPAVIDGLLRRGETANIIAPSKIGKSWLAMELALSISRGRPWFRRFSTVPGKVLIIDNELQPATLAYRLQTLADRLNLLNHECVKSINVMSLRGKLCDIFELEDRISGFRPGEYLVVILDAFYRMLPPEASENDNSAIAAAYNQIDAYAQHTQAAWVVVHHSTKGNQSGKAVTDVGAGAGSQSRAVDAHIILRPHEEDGAYVLDAAVRSFPPVQPLALRWEFPLWSIAPDLDSSALLRSAKKKGDDRERAEKILAAIRGGNHTQTSIIGVAGMGLPCFRKLIKKLVADGQIETRPSGQRGAKTEYHIAARGDDGMASSLLHAGG